MARDKQEISRNFPSELPIRSAKSKTAKLPQRTKRPLPGKKFHTSIRRTNKLSSFKAFARKGRKLQNNAHDQKIVREKGKLKATKGMRIDVMELAEGKTEIGQYSDEEGSEGRESLITDASSDYETMTTQDYQEAETEEFPILATPSEDQMKTSQQPREEEPEDSEFSISNLNGIGRQSNLPNWGRTWPGGSAEEDDAIDDNSDDSDARSITLIPRHLNPQKERDVYALYLRKQIIRTYQSEKARGDKDKIRTTTIGIYEDLGDATAEVFSGFLYKA